MRLEPNARLEIQGFVKSLSLCLIARPFGFRNKSRFPLLTASSPV